MLTVAPMRPIVLFAVLRPELTARIKDGIKQALTARHVPNDTFQVAAVPRTMSGKKMELPIKKLLLGQPIEKVASPDSMANPESLAWLVVFARGRGWRVEPELTVHCARHSRG